MLLASSRGCTILPSEGLAVWQGPRRILLVKVPPFDLVITLHTICRHRRNLGTVRTELGARIQENSDYTQWSINIVMFWCLNGALIQVIDCSLSRISQPETMTYDGPHFLWAKHLLRINIIKQWNLIFKLTLCWRVTCLDRERVSRLSIRYKTIGWEYPHMQLHLLSPPHRPRSQEYAKLH